MKNKKVAWIMILITVLLFLVGWFLIYWELYIQSSRQWAWSVVVFFVAIVFYLLALFVAKSKVQLYFLIGGILVFSLILGRERWYAMTFILLASFLLTQVGAFIVKREQEQRVKINLIWTLKRGLPILGTALSLLWSGGFYFSLINNQEMNEVPRLKVNVPASFNKAGLGLVKLIIPSTETRLLGENVTIDQFLRQRMKKQTEQFIPNGVETAEMEKGVLSQLELSEDVFLIEARKNFSEQIGIELKGDEPMTEVVNLMLNQRIDTFVNGQNKTSKKFLPIGMALAVFITTRSIFWLMIFPILWTATLIFAMMKRFNWIEVREEQKTVEVIF